MKPLATTVVWFGTNRKVFKDVYVRKGKQTFPKMFYEILGFEMKALQTVVLHV